LRTSRIVPNRSRSIIRLKKRDPEARIETFLLCRIRTF
jgi:hypothetical protein